MTFTKPDNYVGRIAAGLSAALILLSIGGFWFYHSQAASARQGVLAGMEQIGQNQAAAIAGWRRTQLEDADNVMKTPFFAREVIRFLTDPQGSHAHLLETRIASLQSGYQYDEIRVVDVHGRVRLGRALTKAGQTILAEAVANALALGRPVFARMHRFGKHSKPGVSVVAPIFGQAPASVLPEFQPLGAVVLVRKAEATLYPLLRTWPMPSATAETLLIRRDDKEAVFLNHLALYPDTALKVRVPLTREDVLVVMAVNGRTGVVEAADYRGEKVVAALAPVPDSSWWVVAKQDASEVYAQWRSQSHFLLTLFATLAGIIVVTGLLLWQRYSTVRYRRLYQTEARLRLEEKRHLQALEEKEKLAAQLIQAQKMESVGRLAGGVAHDYNNMLNVILGYAEMALAGLNPSDPLHDKLKKIHHAATRSADITRQLLAFARKQTIDPRVLDLNDTIEKGVFPILNRLIGEDIHLSWKPGTDLWPVKMDPVQIDQILANLCVNARDAIADVGKITIETGKTTFDAEYCADHPGFVPGDFLLLTVSDTGSGMDKQTVQKIFEPFFTTKTTGKGTGLGLATVYGIVKQNGGFINVYSEPEKGTTIRVYLARHSDSRIPRAQIEKPAEDAAGHGETVLVVEDEPDILELARAMLEQLDYQVLTAASPSRALARARDHTGPIHLLITDVVLPEMNGRDLARHLASMYPDIKLLFMSGYTANVIAHHGVLEEGVQFIQKPFSMKDIAARVKAVLTLTDEGDEPGNADTLDRAGENV